MDPIGYFSGNTVYTSWKHLIGAVNYSVHIDLCDEEFTCNNVFNDVTPTNMLTVYSYQDFAQCAIYKLKIMALAEDGKVLLTESSLMTKTFYECHRLDQIVLGCSLALLFVAIILFIAGLVWYHKKRKPFQPIQRVRSRVYTRIYNQDRYERPYSKADFISKIPNLIEETKECGDDDELMKTTTLGLEFEELERMSFDTIQRRIISSDSVVNKRRNRYQDIVPFDATRVKLEKPLAIEGELHVSDYINASYISDHSGVHPRSITSVNRSNGGGSGGAVGMRNGSIFYMTDNSTGLSSSISQGNNFKYIAAQGPEARTAQLFWEMIWQQNVRVIVMLTNIVEGFSFNSLKCTMYWPEQVGYWRKYNQIKIQLYDLQEAPDYIVRKLDVTNRDSKSLLEVDNREIVHIQYTAWPDRKAPDDPEALLQLINVSRVLSFQYVDPEQQGPMLVHCSAGVGRTGTFIAVDQLMRIIDDQASFNQNIDIFNLTYKLRRDRRYMIQTVAQYIYVYKCALAYLNRIRTPKISISSDSSGPPPLEPDSEASP